MTEKITVEKLRGSDNYASWSNDLSIILNHYERWSWIEGEHENPPIELIEIEEWQHKGNQPRVLGMKERRKRGDDPHCYDLRTESERSNLAHNTPLGSMEEAQNRTRTEPNQQFGSRFT